MARVRCAGALLTSSLVTSLLLTACVTGFTVDCDRDYADCDKELSKLAEDFDLTTIIPDIQTNKSTKILINKTDTSLKTNAHPKGRLLNMSIEDLQSFANALHNKTQDDIVKKPTMDLSDVSLDDDDFEFPPHAVKEDDSRIVNKATADFVLPDTREIADRSFDETFNCMENGITYKPGEKVERGCEENCDCSSAGSWKCTPRCQLPYVRRGRRLSDPLCYETPVDECCSIIACSTGVDGDLKTSGSSVKREDANSLCRYGNSTYMLNQEWDVGCQQHCSCGPKGVVTCKPRCDALPASEHCINVQDPHDPCCQVQVCDVTHDAHEHVEASPLPPTIIDRMDSDFEDLIVTTTAIPTVKQTPIEPVQELTILKNNSILLTLKHSNTSEKPFHLQLIGNAGVEPKDIKVNNANMIIGNLEPNTEYTLKVVETGKTFRFKIPPAEDESNDVSETTTSITETYTDTHANITTDNGAGCMSEGVMYKVGEEFRIGCAELCECVGPNQKECATLDCPSHVGLELISSTCIRWAPDPPDWVPNPPACCPSKMRCLSDGSCDYKGHKVPNWSEVPETLTGCELRCFCESGTLDCQNICSPLPPVPPQTLRCQPGYKPGAVNISEEDCCKQWGCVLIGSATTNSVQPGKTLPAFLPTVPPEIHFPSDEDLNEFGQNNDIHRPAPPAPKTPPQFQLPSLLPSPGVDPIDNSKLTLRTLVSDTPTSVQILFELSPVLVGLKGSVDLRYTDKDDEDITNWYSQVFAPTNEILTTSRLEFRLTGLKPSTIYKLRGKLYLHNLPLEPVSSIYSVKTLDEPQIQEKRRAVEAGLRVQNVNATAAQVSWRHFTEDELQYIDGIQVRYRPLEQPIYSMTELLHHWRVSVELLDLHPGAHYEASLVLVPPARSRVELYDPKIINFTTPHFYDMYNFSVTVESRREGSDSVEVTWRGVPAPPERYVRVYRAAHSCDGNMAAAPQPHRVHDAFKLADRDQPPKIVLNGLRPDSKCRVWLELFLTNGKVKISNVLDITTKTHDSENSVDNEVLGTAGFGTRAGHASGDYYSALVVVGVVAALGTLTSLLLLLVVMRRHRPHSVSITTVPSAPRAPSTLPPYDNPAYKLELQQETMDL